jgi:hypothetical protein
VPPANRLGLLPLLRGKQGIDLPTGPADDRVQLGLHPASDHTQLTSLTAHDRVDPGLLLVRKSELPGKPISKITIPVGRTTGSMLEPGPGEHPRQENATIDRYAGQPTGERYQQEHEAG